MKALARPARARRLAHRALAGALVAAAAAVPSACEVSLKGVPFTDRSETGDSGTDGGVREGDSCFLDAVVQGAEGDSYEPRRGPCGGNLRCSVVDTCVETRSCEQLSAQEGLPCFIEATHATTSNIDHFYWDAEQYVYRYSYFDGTFTPWVEKTSGQWFSQLFVDSGGTMVAIDGNRLMIAGDDDAVLRQLAELPAGYQQLLVKNDVVYLRLATDELATLDTREPNPERVTIVDAPEGGEIVVSNSTLYRVTSDRKHVARYDLSTHETTTVPLAFEAETLHYVAEIWEPWTEYLVLSSKVDGKPRLWSATPNGNLAGWLTTNENPSALQFYDEWLYFTADVQGTALFFRSYLGGSSGSRAMSRIDSVEQAFTPTPYGLFIQEGPRLQFFPL